MYAIIYRNTPERGEYHEIVEVEGGRLIGDNIKLVKVLEGDLLGMTLPIDIEKVAEDDLDLVPLFIHLNSDLETA
jgi:hypothetical protein